MPGLILFVKIFDRAEEGIVVEGKVLIASVVLTIVDDDKIGGLVGLSRLVGCQNGGSVTRLAGNVFTKMGLGVVLYKGD